MLHKLRVAEIDGARVVLVHLSDLCYVGITQREVEDIKILRHTLLMTRLGNSYDATLCEPTKGNLSSTLIVLGSDGRQLFALHDAFNTLSAERSPSHHLCSELRMNRLDARLLDKRVALQLVHHRLYFHIVGEIEETACLEVAHTDGTNLAITVGFLHRPPCAEHVAVGTRRRRPDG